MLWLSTQISPVLREIVSRKRWVLRSQCGPGYTPRRSTPASNSVLNKLHALDDAGTSYRRPLAHVSLSNGGVVVDRLCVPGTTSQLPARDFEGSFLPQRFGRRRHTHASARLDQRTPAMLARVGFEKSTARQGAADNRHAILRCPAFSYISTRPIDPLSSSDYSSYTLL